MFPDKENEAKLFKINASTINFITKKMENRMFRATNLIPKRPNDSFRINYIFWLKIESFAETSYCL